MKKFSTLAAMIMALGVCASAMAATPQDTSYDFHVNIEKVDNWRVSNLPKKMPITGAAYIPVKVTAKEAKTSGYDDFNVPATNMTEEEWEELFKGNN